MDTTALALYGTLDKLATPVWDEVRPFAERYNDVRTNLVRSFVHAEVEKGQILKEAKAQCKHGAWLCMLQVLGVPEWTAQREMKAASKVEKKPDLLETAKSMRELFRDSIDDDSWKPPMRARRRKTPSDAELPAAEAPPPSGFASGAGGEQRDVIDATSRPAQAPEATAEPQAPEVPEPAAEGDANPTHVQDSDFDTETYCRHCHAPADWLGLVLTGNWAALTELAEAAAAEAA